MGFDLFKKHLSTHENIFIVLSLFQNLISKFLFSTIKIHKNMNQ